MLFIFFIGFWLVVSIIFFPFGGSVLLGVVGASTLVFTLSTLLCSSILSLSVTIFESLKSSMLSTIFIGMIIIFTIQVLVKNSPFLATALFYPIFFIAIYSAVKITTTASSQGTLIISAANILSLYLTSKLTGFALATISHS